MRVPLGSIVLVLVSVLVPGPTVLAQSATGASRGKAYSTSLASPTCNHRLADWMGDPTTCEFANPNATSDVHQRTASGLAFWRNSTNTPTFTSGNEHWALTGLSMVSWTGSSIDPASDAIAFDSSHPRLANCGCRSTGAGR